MFSGPVAQALPVWKIKDNEYEIQQDNHVCSDNVHHVQLYIM